MCVYVCVFPKIHSNALWQVLGPLVLKKVCFLIQGQRTKETGLSQFKSPPPPSCQLTSIRRVVESSWLLGSLTFGSTGAAQSPGRIGPGAPVTSPSLKGRLRWQSEQEVESVTVWLEWLSATSADTGCLNRGSVKRAFVTETSPNSYFTVIRGSQAGTRSGSSLEY